MVLTALDSHNSRYIILLWEYIKPLKCLKVNNIIGVDTMVITVNALQLHINKLDNGILDFSECEMNTRADLVRFEGFTLEQACNIEESEAYNIMEGNSEDEEWETNHYNFTCQCGSKDIKIKWINGHFTQHSSSSSDGYICKCKCEKEFFIHECALDNFEE
jgi:hypothetical protein